MGMGMRACLVCLVVVAHLGSAYVSQDDLDKIEDDFSAIAQLLAAKTENKKSRSLQLDDNQGFRVEHPSVRVLSKKEQGIDAGQLALAASTLQHMGKLDYGLNANQDNVPVAPFGPQVRPQLVKFKMPENADRSITPLAGIKGVEYEKLPEPVVNVKDKYEMAEDADVNMYQLITSGPCVTSSLMPEANEMARGAGVDCGIVGTHQVGKSRKPGEEACPGSPYECSNNGICRHGVCTCLAEWEKEDCSNYKCVPKCHSRATCDNGTCVCPPGWGGPQCTEKTCNPPCTVNGICQDAVCVCSPGFYGEECEIALCPGIPQCGGYEHGFCNGATGECSCNTGWGGSDCSQVVVPCESECQNQGTCMNGTCACAPGYTGTYCQSVVPRDYVCEGGAVWEEFVSPLVRTCGNIFHSDPNGVDMYTARCICPPSEPVWDASTRSCVSTQFCGESLCGVMGVPGPNEAIMGIYQNKPNCDTNATGTCSGCALSTEDVGVCFRAGAGVTEKMATSVEVILGLERQGGACPGDYESADFEAMLANSNLGAKGFDSQASNSDGTTTIVHTVIVAPRPDFLETPRVNLTSALSLKNKKTAPASGYFNIKVNCSGTYRVAMVLVDGDNLVDMFSDCLFTVEKPTCPGNPLCSGNGQCDTSFETPQCSCDNGFTGEKCDIAYQKLAYGKTVTTLPGGIMTSLHIPEQAKTQIKTDSTVITAGNETDGYTVMTFFTNGTVIIEHPDGNMETIMEHHKTDVQVSETEIEVVDLNGTVLSKKKGNGTKLGLGKCPSNQIWQQCSSGCMPSCRNPEPRCMPTCLQSSCQCPIEYPLWDEQAEACVVPLMCSVQSECPGTGAICSGNGYCVSYSEDDPFATGSRCVCFDGWSGDECNVYKERQPRATKAGGSGTTSDAIPCHFPFQYRGKEYFDCTTDFDTDGVEWCSTTYEWEGMWGLCAPRNSCPSKEGVACSGRGACYNGACKCHKGYSGPACDDRVFRWVNVSGTNNTADSIKCAFPYVGPDNKEHYDCMRGTPLIDADGDLVGYSNGTTEWCLTTTIWHNFSSFGYCLPKGNCGLCPSSYGTCNYGTGECVCKPGRAGESCLTRLTQVEILNKFYSDTRGHYWTRSGGWGSAVDPCGDAATGAGAWSGVTCKEGKVTRLVLNSAGLTGTISSELAALSKLQVLDLSNNMLTGAIPKVFSDMPASLTSLVLSNNHLTGIVPAVHERLSYMDVTNNYFVSGLTSSFDLGYAHRVTNGEGTANAFTECAFPFEFNGRQYLQCTNDFSNSGEAWCATDPVYSGQWGKCAIPGTCAGEGGVQCSGNGQCEVIYTSHGAAGKCNCFEGWYGAECATRAIRVTKTVKTGVYEEHHGRQCQLPFEYEGNLYKDCTTIGSVTGEPWCLLTKQWERQWGYCAPVGTCPGRDANCSGHGECMPDGSCQCYPGFGWNDCSKQMPRVTSGVYQPKGTVCHFPFTLNGVEYNNCTTAPTFEGDPYCAVKPGELTVSRQWDYCAPPGTCPGFPECSGDGVCYEGECACDPGYTGLACEHEMTDRDILTKLFRSTGGQYWLQSAGWEALHECQWYGITCNLEGRVSGISLPKNNMDGTVPVELALISTLLAIDLSGNYLAGTVPERLSALPLLQTLDISDNQFVGELPTFPKMKSLKCGQNCLSESKCSMKNTCLDSLRRDVFNITIDCNINASMCDTNAICVENDPGVYKCVCQAGYNGNGKQCAENTCRLPGPSGTNGYVFAGDITTNTVSGLKRITCGRGYKQPGVGAKAPKATCLTPHQLFDFSGCTVCPKGQYQPSQDQRICIPCAPGTWNSQEGALFCEACPIATFGNRTGMISQKQCTLCPYGKFGAGVGMASMSLACTDCNPGNYQDERGKTDCKECDSSLAEYQNDYGQRVCDVDCHGVFSQCGADCYKTWSVVLESQGNGLACDHVDGFSAQCADGEGLCSIHAALARSAKNAR